MSRRITTGELEFSNEVKDGGVHRYWKCMVLVAVIEMVNGELAWCGVQSWRMLS